MGSQRQEITGLLGLPPEIRDQIYTAILHPDNNRTYQADEYTDYDFRAALALLRVNRQIHHEARAVFRTVAVFVRVETPWPEAEHHVRIVGHVPILLNGARAASFTDHTLQVVIETPTTGDDPGAGGGGGGSGTHNHHYMVMLADDLAAFTKAWFYWNLSHAGLNQWLGLHLYLRDPWAAAADWDEKHVRRDVQRRLLLPFGDVKGLRDFTMKGSPAPQPKIAAEVRALQAVAPAPPEDCLAEGIRWKNEGNKLLQGTGTGSGSGKGDPRAALAAYGRAWEAIHIVVKGRQRHVHAEAFFARELVGGSFAGKNGQIERMALRLQLVANTCLAYLQLGDWRELQFWGMRTIRLMRQATGANDAPVPPEDEALLGFPSAPQVGKIYYRTARAYQELGDPDEARRLLRVASVYLPHDATVKTALAALLPPPLALG